MKNDVICDILESFEKEDAELWFDAEIYEKDLIDKVVSDQFKVLWDYLDKLGYEPISCMEEVDPGIHIILSRHKATGLCSIDVITGDVHLYKIFGDIRLASPYDFDTDEGKGNIYRAFADLCIWMDAAKNNEPEYRISHCENLWYKHIG